MQKTVYTHTASGQSWDYRLPKILRWNGVSTSNITEDNMGDFGITKTTVDIPDAPPPEVTPAPPADTDALAAKERAFAAMLAHYAAAFHIDLAALPDINIGAMLAAAQQAGVSPADIADATTALEILKNVRGTAAKLFVVHTEDL